MIHYHRLSMHITQQIRVSRLHASRLCINSACPGVLVAPSGEALEPAQNLKQGEGGGSARAASTSYDGWRPLKFSTQRIHL